MGPGPGKVSRARSDKQAPTQRKSARHIYPLGLYTKRIKAQPVQVKGDAPQAPQVQTKEVLPAQIRAKAHPLDVHHPQGIALLTKLWCYNREHIAAKSRVVGIPSAEKSKAMKGQQRGAEGMRAFSQPRA